MAITEVTAQNFDAEVLNADKPVIVDFWASWCGPCKQLSPLVDELAQETDTVKFCKVNVDEQPELASRFRIMSIPTLLVFKDGTQTNMSIGLIPKAAILALV